MEDTKTPDSKPSRGPGSFCIPRAALNALLDSGATAYEVCTYLTLARFTDESGRYSTASISAVNRYTGANKTKGGPVDRALERLKTIRAKSVKKVSNGRSGKSHAWVDQVTDLGPILFDREGWFQATGELLPDGAHQRAEVLHVLPDFEEPPEDRVWFGNNLVSGVGGFTQPLKALKNAGDVAARLLLALYEVNDMETWGGVRPVGAGHGPWVNYEPVDVDVRWTGIGARLHRAKRGGEVGPGDMFSRACPFSEKPGSWWESHAQAGGPVWRALEALQSSGLVYEVVMVLNRNAIKAKFSSGTEYSGIPGDAEPFYELDCRSKHGYKPDGEEGVGWATAKTAGDFRKPVTLLFSARTEADVYARGLMAWWRTKHRAFDYRITLTREEAEGCLSGRVDAVLPGLFPDLSKHTIFAAGSPAFVDSCVATVKALGARPELIHTEGFFARQQPEIPDAAHLLNL